ncbi:MAG TPA: AarF/ABC1/UbiB kinase family protein [Armatimonadota bacterium]|jgi:ubiquinone biosynthesis protein
MASSVATHRRKRYSEIGQVLVRNGFYWLMAEWRLDEILGRVRNWRGRAKSPALTQPERVRNALDELGPTFIKLGQILSTRPDLLPPEYIAELSKLQDQARHEAFSDIAATIKRELGAPPEEVFRTFAVEPRAAASIGQVHDAVMLDGTHVVVKVQRPAIEAVVEEDLAILGDLARFLSKNSRIGKQYDLEGWVDEFAITLRNELDYVREGRNADRIRANFAADPSLLVPRIYWEHTTKRVLTMEEIAGIKISDLDALDAAGIDRASLAERCAHIAVVQVLDHGFFHADPHPGNFFVQSNGTIALLDYGMVGQVEDRLGQSLVRLAIAVTRQDADGLVDELLALGAAPGPVDRGALRRDLKRLLQRYSGQPLGEVTAANVFGDITTVSRRHHLQLPSDLTLLTKVIAMDEGLGAFLDPDFNLLEFAKPYLKRFWRRSHSLRVITRRAREGAIDMAEIGLDLPQRLRHLLVQLDRGELSVASRFEVPEEVARRFERAANRISISIIAAGIAIGLSVLAAIYRPAGSDDIGIFLLRAAIALGIACCLWLLGAFWRSGR